MRELLLAVRRLRGDRWAAGGAILAAALGAGLNTAVFAVAYGVLGRPLPYADPGRLVVLSASVPFAQIDEWRTRLPSFAALTGYAQENLTLQGAGDARLATMALVDDRFFETLGSHPVTGRTFAAGDMGLVVFSERFARQSGLDIARAPGMAVTIGDAVLTVAGVMRSQFAFPGDRIDAWMRGDAARAIVFDRSNDARRFRLVGRLKPGVTLNQAAIEATRARAEVSPERRDEKEPVRVESLPDVLVGAVRPVLRAFSAAAAIVLLVACANVATILIGRTLSRERELAVRRALGASPRDLIASVVAESLLISFAGAALGIAIAVGAVRLVERWAAGIIPRLDGITVDWTVLLFATAVAATSTLLAALPAFRTVRAGSSNLRVNAIGARPGDRRLRSALIVTQIALAVILLAGGGLLARTIAGLLRADIGVVTRDASVTQLLLTEGASFTAAARGPVLAELLRRVRELPQVRAAGAGSALPPDHASIEITIRFVQDGKETLQSFSASPVTPGYLPAIGARILAGRDFADGDERSPQLRVVLSRSAALAFAADGNMLGREVPLALPGLRQRGRPRVVGIVSDIKYSGLAAPAGPAIYVTWAEFPAGHTHLAIRASADPAVLAASIRAIVRSVDPRIPAMPLRSLDDVVQRSVSDRRLNALLGASVALLAFAVAMVGLAAGLMRVVSERRQELAIRAALGATPARAMRLILGEGALLAAMGVAAGCAGAIGVGRALRTLLHGVSPHDPLTLAGVVVLVGAASLAACYLPARRASRIDPLTLLRAE